MHILCTICSDLVNTAENIHVTKCGHIFHYHCLSQWIVRSKSCPQCRNKVTDKCIFRIYPTISNEPTQDDAATLQLRLDDVQLQLREQKAFYKDREEKLKAVEAEKKENLSLLFRALLKLIEKKMESKESDISALKKQLDYVKVENREIHKLKEENEKLINKLATLTGMERVLNATSHEVDTMLQSYSDVKTVATFATALKAALSDSENKKNELRNKLQLMKQQLAVEKNVNNDLKSHLVLVEEKLIKYKNLTIKRKKENLIESAIHETRREAQKRKCSDDFNCAIIQPNNNTSITSMVNRIENADSPYLSLKQSSLALTALQMLPKNPIQDTNLKPSEYALLNSARNAVKKPDTIQKTSIFHKKEPVKIQLSQDSDSNSGFDLSYDGLGGHSKLDTFPKPKPAKNLVPKLSAKHKLKRPNPVGNHDIGQMIKKMKD